jgi:hypothetical protein
MFLQEKEMASTKRYVLAALTILIAMATGCSSAPYHLTVRVTDEDGNPMPQASVLLFERNEVLLTDDAGQVSWRRLELDSVVLSVSADAYSPYTTRLEMERGNNVTIVPLQLASTDPAMASP